MPASGFSEVVFDLDIERVLLLSLALDVGGFVSFDTEFESPLDFASAFSSCFLEVIALAVFSTVILSDSEPLTFSVPSPLELDTDTSHPEELVRLVRLGEDCELEALDNLSLLIGIL